MKRLWNKPKKSKSMISWLLLGGAFVLTLAPKIKRTIQATEITETTQENVQKAAKASNMLLGKVKRKIKHFVEDTDIAQERNNEEFVKKVRMRKRDLVLRTRSRDNL